MLTYLKVEYSVLCKITITPNYNRAGYLVGGSLHYYKCVLQNISSRLHIFFSGFTICTRILHKAPSPLIDCTLSYCTLNVDKKLCLLNFMFIRELFADDFVCLFRDNPLGISVGVSRNISTVCDCALLSRLFTKFFTKILFHFLFCYLYSIIVTNVCLYIYMFAVTL